MAAMIHSRRDTGLHHRPAAADPGGGRGSALLQPRRQSLWADEGNSAALATRSLVPIAVDASHDIHPPLYYWLLHLWTRLFGTSEIGLRSLSALMGMMLVLVIAILGRRIFNRATGPGRRVLRRPRTVPGLLQPGSAHVYPGGAGGGAGGAIFFWYVSQEAARLPERQAHAAGAPAPDVRAALLPFSGQLLVLACAAGLYTHYAFRVDDRAADAALSQSG